MASFHGSDCQQTKHSFHGNGYAWFRPIRPCFENFLSLEFITDVPDGLLLYNGPLSETGPGNSEHFIAIGIIYVEHNITSLFTGVRGRGQLLFGKQMVPEPNIIT